MLTQLLARVLAWFQGEEGQDMIEYALIATFIAIPIVLVTVGLLVPAVQEWAIVVAGEVTSLV